MATKITFPCTVEIAGSWSRTWEHQLCKINSDGMFEIDLKLAPGIYEYKILLNGVWSHDPTKPTTQNEFGGLNNILVVEKDYAFANEAETSIPIQSTVSMSGAKGLEWETNKKTENKKCLKKTVSFEDEKPKFQKEKTPSEPNTRLAEHFGATSFISVLKQFGRHNGKEENRKVTNVCQEENKTNEIEDNSNKIIQPSTIPKEGININSPDLSDDNNLVKECRKIDNLEEISSFYQSNVQRIDDKCNMLKNMLEEFLTDIQEDDKASTIDFPFSTNEVSIMTEVDNNQDSAKTLMSDDEEKDKLEFPKSEKHVVDSLIDDSNQVNYIEDFYETLLCEEVQNDSPNDLESQVNFREEDKEEEKMESSKIEQFIMQCLIDESHEGTKIEDIYATLLCEDVHSYSSNDPEYPNNNWEDYKEDENTAFSQNEEQILEGLIDERREVIKREDFYATLLCNYVENDSPDDLEYKVNYWDTAFLFDHDDEEMKICSNLCDQEAEFTVSDFHAESHAALQAEKMHEMLTLKETTCEVSKQVMDEIIDLSKEAFRATKINSYIDDIYDDIKSKKENTPAKSKLMSYIDDVYSEMKSSKIPEQSSNDNEFQQKVKNNFETYVNDVYQELKTTKEPTITVHSKLMSYVDDAYYQIKTQKVQEAAEEDRSQVKDKLFDYIDDVYMQIKANKEPQANRAEYKKDSFGKEEIISSSVQDSLHQGKEIIPSESLTSMTAHCPWIAEDTKTSFTSHFTNIVNTEHLFSPVSHKPVIADFSKGTSILSHEVNNFESKGNNGDDILPSSMVAHLIQNPFKVDKISEISHQFFQPILTTEYTPVSHQAGTEEYLDIQIKHDTITQKKDTSLQTIHQKSSVQFDLELVASIIEDDSIPNLLTSAQKEDSTSDDEYIVCDSGYNSLKRSKTYPTDMYQTDPNKQKGDLFSFSKDIENRWVLIEDLDSKYENEMGIDQENLYDDAVIDECCNIKTDESPKGTKIDKEAAKVANKLRCVQQLMEDKFKNILVPNQEHEANVNAKIHKNSERRANQMDSIDSFMPAKYTNNSDFEKVSRSSSINLPDLEIVVKGTNSILEVVEPVYCSNQSHRHFDLRGRIKSAPSSPYHSLKKSKKIKEHKTLQSESGCISYNTFAGNLSSYEKVISAMPLTVFTKEAPQEHMKAVNSMVCVHRMLNNKLEIKTILTEKAKQLEIMAQDSLQDSMKVINSMASVHTFLNNKFVTNSLTRPEEIPDMNRLTMVAHEIKKETYKHNHDIAKHDLKILSDLAHNVNNEDNFTMIAHEVTHEKEKPAPLILASNALEERDVTMLAHEVNERVGRAHNHNDDSYFTMAAHEVKEAYDKSNLTMLTHELGFVKLMNQFPLTMKSHQVEDSPKTASTTILAHTFMKTSEEGPNISAVAHAGRSQSVESDTVVADIERDEDDLLEEEVDDIYSSDDEWEYERKDKSDHNKNIKHLEKNNKSPNAEALNKEMEIMKEIIQNDIGSRNELDLELCELLSPQVYGDTIERTSSDQSVFTDIKKIEEQLIKSIEVIEIAEEVTADSVITKEDKNKQEVKNMEQEIIFPWDIKVRSNWTSSCKDDEIKIQHDGNLMMDLQNIKPGSYKFKFLINGTSFCDETLPHERDYFDSKNTFILWSNNTQPLLASGVTINTQVTIPWKVQLTGNWTVNPAIVDCQVCTNGDVVAKLPTLSPGCYQYSFLINNCHFVDESLPCREDYLTNHNILLVKQNGQVVWESSC